MIFDGILIQYFFAYLFFFSILACPLWPVSSFQELFIMYLTKLAQRNGDCDEEVLYADLASIVQKKDSMEFLHDIVPKKIKFKEFLALMQREENGGMDEENVL